jgi:hypothetical protein
MREGIIDVTDEILVLEIREASSELFGAVSWQMSWQRPDLEISDIS